MQAEHWRELLGEQELSDGDEVGVSVDMREVAIYRSVTDPAEIWVRPREEFEDGRFELVSPATPSPFPKGEPVAWVPVGPTGEVHYIEIQTSLDQFASHWTEDGYTFKALYAHPAPLPVTITDEMVHAAILAHDGHAADRSSTKLSYTDANRMRTALTAALSSHRAGEPQP